MAGNKLLMERAHRDGSPLKGRLNVMKRVLDPIGDHIDDKPMINDLKRSSSNKKSNGTPMKMLIAQEMSNEMESKMKPPSVVARLMGLDGLPAQKPVSGLQKSSSEVNFRKASTKKQSLPRHQVQDNGYRDKHCHSQCYSLEQTRCKDVYEIWLQSTKSGFVKDQSQHKARHNENANEKRLALVRQKFIEAKRLATDERCHQSKEFQDALEVLNSNRDLFLKFLQEPNPSFSKHLYELQSIPPPPQTKCITVLKPSKMQKIERCVRLEAKCEKKIKRRQDLKLNEWDNNDHPTWNSFFSNQKVDYSSQPTRIVVLKPSPGETHNIRTGVSSPTSPPILPEDKYFCGEFGTDALKGSRKIAKEITWQMQESLRSEQRDEGLPSFILSNGYMGDESKRLGNEYIKEGNFSDSEIMTPTSRHSWDCNRYDSPYSTSSLSQASYTSESSVTREAKKRLSERWAMMTSTGSRQEQRQVRRSSSTLGEMLALSDMKEPIKSREDGNNEGPSVSSSRSCSGEEESSVPRPQLSSHVDKDEGGEHSPKNLSRSRSVPGSSTAYEKVELSAEAPDSIVSKPIKEAAKPKSGKSSLKGKVSSFFFSRNKKPSKEKSGSSSLDSSHVGTQPSSTELPGTSPAQLSVGQRSYNNLEGGRNGSLEGRPFNLGGSSCEVSSPTGSIGPNQQKTCASQASLAVAKPQSHDNSSENQDQPSPISVLEVQFEDDVCTPMSCEIVNRNHHHEQFADLSHKSESTGKSPMESVVRTLFCDEKTNSGLSTPFVLEHSVLTSKAAEGQWFSFVQALLSTAGLDHETSDTVFARWHSPVSPLDPSLLEKCMDQIKEMKQLSEARRRQLRSEYRLLFDSVNVAVMDMVKCRFHAIPLISGQCKLVEPDLPVTKEVVVWLREWFSVQHKWLSAETDASLLVEKEVRQEVVGKRWEEMEVLQIEAIGTEIEGKMLGELLEEAFSNFTLGLL